MTKSAFKLLPLFFLNNLTKSTAMFKTSLKPNLSNERIDLTLDDKLNESSFEKPTFKPL